MADPTPETENTITVTNNLGTVPDTNVDLFSRILRAVREQTQEDKQRRNSGKTAA
jgi:hypothetical protein